MEISTSGLNHNQFAEVEAISISSPVGFAPWEGAVIIRVTDDLITRLCKSYAPPDVLLCRSTLAHLDVIRQVTPPFPIIANTFLTNSSAFTSGPASGRRLLHPLTVHSCNQCHI